MPLVDYNLEFLKRALDLAAADGPGRALGFFACPDILCRRERLRELFGAAADAAPARPDRDGILAWHHPAKPLLLEAPVPDTHAFFGALGWSCVSYDLTRARGCETVCDLCDPLPPAASGRHDVVFDCISHQCFDVAAVWRNALACTRPGGYVVHCLPAAMVGHGFWDVAPLAFRAFYEANGGAVVDQKLVVGVYAAWELLGVPAGRAAALPEKSMNLVLARTGPRAGGPVNPVHPKFVRHPHSRLPAARPEVP